MKPIYQVFVVILLLGMSACAAPAVAPTVTPEAPAPVEAAPTFTFVPAPTFVAESTPVTLLEIKFDQKFEEAKCPSGSAAGALCFNVSGTASDPVWGEMTLSRVAVLDVAGKKDENQCVSAFTHGKLVVAGDSAIYNAMGKYCPETSTASYIYIFTNGTGAYAKSSGSGTITVPAPSGSGTGTEVWSGTLLK